MRNQKWIDVLPADGRHWMALMKAFDVKWKHEILAVLVRFPQAVQVYCT